MGEVFRGFPRFVSGYLDLPAPTGHVCGTAEQWAGNLYVRDKRSQALDAWGLPVCCGGMADRVLWLEKESWAALPSARIRPSWLETQSWTAVAYSSSAVTVEVDWRSAESWKSNLTSITLAVWDEAESVSGLPLVVPFAWWSEVEDFAAEVHSWPLLPVDWQEAESWSAVRSALPACATMTQCGGVCLPARLELYFDNVNLNALPVNRRTIQLVWDADVGWWTDPLHQTFFTVGVGTWGDFFVRDTGLGVRLFWTENGVQKSSLRFLNDCNTPLFEAFYNSVTLQWAWWVSKVGTWSKPVGSVWARVIPGKAPFGSYQ